MNNLVIIYLLVISVILCHQVNRINDLKFRSDWNDVYVNKLQSDIKQSRNREELLYREVKNLDYLTSILTTKYQK